MRSFLVVCLLALTGCAGQAEASQRSTPAAGTAVSSVGPWTKTAAATTCGDFDSRMTSRQRSVLVAGLLTGLRRPSGVVDPPAEVVVAGFGAAITDSCRGVPAAYAVTDVARSVYLTQRARWRR